MISVVLPHHLRTLVQVGKEVELQVEGPTTLGLVLDTLLPNEITMGAEPFRIVGAMAGG